MARNLSEQPAGIDATTFSIALTSEPPLTLSHWLE
jgi:hypothetical protein